MSACGPAERKSEMIRVRCSICTCLSSFCAGEQRVSFAFYRILIMCMLSTSASLGRAFFALDICPARKMFLAESASGDSLHGTRDPAGERDRENGREGEAEGSNSR